VYALKKEGFGDWRDGDIGSRVCKALGIVGGPENGYGVVWIAEGFHAFVGLLAIVERWCHAMETKVGVCYEGWRRPDTCLHRVVGLNMAVDFIVLPKEPGRGVLEGYLRGL
jgi:hypothetical protein